MKHSFSTIRPLLILCLAWTFLLGWAPAEGRSPAPLRYDFADAVNTLLDEVGRGAEAGRQVLEDLDGPTREALSGMSSGGNSHFAGFSARTRILMLYKLAEEHRPGEGKRFLAKLRRKIAATADVADMDPYWRRAIGPFDPVELDRHLGFADPQAVAEELLLRPLPIDVQSIVDLLSEAAAPDDFGMAAGLLEANFRLASDNESPRQIIDRTLMRTRDRREALRRVIRAHVPPPSLVDAAYGLMVDVLPADDRVAVDEGVSRALRELAEETLPDILQNYSDKSDRLPSRAAQRNASPRDTSASPQRGHGAAQQALMKILIEGAAEEAEEAGGPSYQDTRHGHARYVQAVHSGADGVSRVYSRAILSSRAARGVVVGAKVAVPQARPEHVFWLPCRGNPEFGRIVVKLHGGDRLAATRHLFADSLEAAASMLWGDHGQTAEFRDGEFTILASMDPDSSIGDAERGEITSKVEPELEELRDKVEALDPESSSGAGGHVIISIMLDLLRELKAVETAARAKLSEIPRGIVIHPALHGRELAWSAARVDFWFNDLERVSAEGAELNGGNAMPSLIREKLSGRADTWQFYERDKQIAIINDSGRPADLLRVRSRPLKADGEFTAENHFAVSLFSYGGAQPAPSAEQAEEEDVWRLVGEEAAVQPMLDWAFAYHHDFMRLNDFSEALSVLRWMDRSGQRLVIIDPDGAPAKIATPDRVFIKKVSPHAGQQE